MVGISDRAIKEGILERKGMHSAKTPTEDYSGVFPPPTFDEGMMDGDADRRG